MSSFIEKPKLLSLVATKAVTDEHIADYLQGLAYEAWSEGKDLAATEEVVVGQDENENDIIETKLVHIYKEVEVDIGAWKKENYALLRKYEYPPIEEYMDAYVKANTTAIKAYKDKCLAVKEKYPK